MIANHKLMVYLDGTEESLNAAEYAIYLAKKLDAELFALYIVDIKTLEDLLKANIFVKSEELDFERDLEEDGKRYLKEIEIMGKEKNVTVKTFLSKGEINEESIKKIEELNINLLLVGEFDISESRTNIVYSETERIFRRAKCQVLVIKDEDNAHDLFDTI